VFHEAGLGYVFGISGGQTDQIIPTRRAPRRLLWTAAPGCNNDASPEGAEAEVHTPHGATLQDTLNGDYADFDNQLVAGFDRR
jgi:hypothetical protein